MPPELAGSLWRMSSAVLYYKCMPSPGGQINRMEGPGHPDDLAAPGRRDGTLGKGTGPLRREDETQTTNDHRIRCFNIRSITTGRQLDARRSVMACQRSPPEDIGPIGSQPSFNSDSTNPFQKFRSDVESPPV
jgi:hypothetical protein